MKINLLKCTQPPAHLFQCEIHKNIWILPLSPNSNDSSTIDSFVFKFIWDRLTMYYSAHVHYNEEPCHLALWCGPLMYF